MIDMQPKKMIILDILHILKKHSDKDHSTIYKNYWNRNME